MLDKFFKHIQDNLNFLQEKKLLVTVSGGVDSMVLVYLLYKLDMDMALAHCNFSLRMGNSDKDELFVKRLAKQLKISVFVKKFPTREFADKNKISIQMAARDLRYHWFETLRKENNFDYILTAHHLDDQIETFLLNLSRGTGIEGLIGMALKNGNIIRPLLNFSKDEIKQFAKENGIYWREDESNKDEKYIRNKLRHRILPILKEINPNFLESFQNTLTYLNYTSDIAITFINKVKGDIFEQEGDITKINISKLKRLYPLKMYIYQLFAPYGFTQIEDIYKSLERDPSKQFYSVSHRLVRDRTHLLLTKKDIHTNTREVLIQKNTKYINFPFKLELSIEKNIQVNDDRSIAILDFDKLLFPLTLRKWRAQDEFIPLGLKGKKRLGKFLRDEKLSVLEKENIWLICSENDVVWVVNHRIDDRFKITDSTENSYKITLSL